MSRFACVQYTATGGLKATFTTSYVHTVIIYIALALFTLTVYAGSKDLGLGSIGKVRSLNSLLHAHARHRAACTMTSMQPVRA